MTVLVSFGAKAVGNGGFGTLGSLIPPESFFYDDVDSPTAEFRGEITVFPIHGTIFAFNNGEFIYSGDGTPDSFTYVSYKDGAEIGGGVVSLGAGGGATNSFSSNSISASEFTYTPDLTSSFSGSNASSSSVTYTAEQGGSNKNSSFSSESASASSFVYSPDLVSYISSGTESASSFNYTASLSASFISYNVSQSTFTQFIPTPEQPAVDLQISSYGNNKQWKQSIFFTQFL